MPEGIGPAGETLTTNNGATKPPSIPMTDLLQITGGGETSAQNRSSAVAPEGSGNGQQGTMSSMEQLMDIDLVMHGLSSACVTSDADRVAAVRIPIPHCVIPDASVGGAMAAAVAEPRHVYIGTPRTGRPASRSSSFRQS